MARILITGASGMIGSALGKALLAKGHELHHLGRSVRTDARSSSFTWDVAAGRIDERCLEGVTHVVHLAGAGIADRRWNAARVRELISSRSASARLLLGAVDRGAGHPRVIVSAAGINYYGATTSERIFTEDDPPGQDTIARISREWEAGVDAWEKVARVVKLRSPMVLSRSGGALAKLAVPVRLGLGAALGTGRQWMPWVHIDDLVSIYMEALFNERYKGAYNVNTGNDVTNDDFMRTLAHVIGRPYFLPNVPGSLLKAVLGEMSSILLEGSRASNDKLLRTGFMFKYPRLEEALRDLLGRDHHD